MITTRRLLTCILTGNFAFAFHLANAATCECPPSGVPDDKHVCIRTIIIKGKELHYNQLYLIKFSGKEEGNRIGRFSGAATHLVMVSQQGLAESSHPPFNQQGNGSLAQASDLLPKGAVVLARPFTFTWAERGDPHVVADFRNQLRKQVIVHVNQPLTLVGSVSFVRDPRRAPQWEERIGAAIGGATQFLSPIVATTHPATGAIMAGAQTLTTLLKQTFWPSNTADNAREALGELRQSGVVNSVCELPLRPGSFEVRTRISTVTVDVSPVDSLVRLGEAVEFAQHFASAVAAKSEAFKAQFLLASQEATENNERTCLMANTALAEVGLRDDLDRGAALLRLALNAGLSKQEILACLPHELASALTSAESAPFENRIWIGADRDTQKFTAGDVSSFYYTSPWPYCQVTQPGNWLDHLNTAARDFSSNAYEINSDYFGENVLLVDLTTTPSSEQQTTGPDQLRTALKSRGIDSLKCYPLAERQYHCARYACIGSPAVGGGNNGEANNQSVLIFPYIKEAKIQALKLLRDTAFIDKLKQGDERPQLDLAQPGE